MDCTRVVCVVLFGVSLLLSTSEAIIDLLQLPNVNIFYVGRVVGETPIEQAIDGDTTTYAESSNSKNAGVILEFPEPVFIVHINVSEMFNTDSPNIRPVGYDGYFFNGNCYMVFNETVDWAVARTRCEAEGDASHLVTIDSIEENTFVFGLTIYEQVTPMWIEWVNGESGVSYSNFNEDVDGEPVECVSIGGGESAKWNWQNCADSPLRYMCKRPASNRAIVHSKSTSGKHVRTRKMAEQHDNVTSGICSLHCMNYAGCLSFSYSDRTRECRLSDTVEVDKDLMDSSYASYYIQHHLFEMCNF